MLEPRCSCKVVFFNSRWPSIQGILRCGLLAAFLALSLWTTRDALALSPTTNIDQLHHTAWSQRDGAPPGVLSMAQTGDGYLWLGTHNGLYRFDGVKFELYKCPDGSQLPSLSISALFVDQQKRLWIGSRFGGISMMEPGKPVRIYSVREGLPPGTVKALAQGIDGVLWAGTTAGLASLSNGNWTLHPEFTNVRISALAVDSRGALWIGSDRGLARMIPGSRSASVGSGENYNRINNIFLTPNGRLWIQRDSVTLDLGSIDSPAAPRRLFSDMTDPRILFDRDGNLWVGQRQLVRYPRTGPTFDLAAGKQEYKQSNGLSGREIYVLFEDREGNLWAATSNGVDRFRNNRLSRLVEPSTVTPKLWFTSATDLWIGTPETAPVRLRDNVPQSIPELGPNMTAIVRAPDGADMIATDTGLWRVKGDAISPVPVHTAVSAEHPVQSMVYDQQGQLWLSQVRVGLFQFTHGQWRSDPLPGLFQGPPVSMYVDQVGRVWFGYTNNRLAVVDRGQVRRYETGNGLNLGNVMSFHSDQRHLWIGGDRGVAEFDGKNFRLLTGKDGNSFRGATGLTTSGDGTLWINGSDGITSVAARELARLRADPSKHVDYGRFDYEDGLPGLAGEIRSLPSISTGGDGKLWFATSDGISWIDPMHIQRNPLAPPVIIRGIRSNEQYYNARYKPLLPKHTTELEIEYTATSLTIPERVQFRYRLEGVDPVWRDVGTRRIAFYNNLAPGDYNFKVIASNEDGLWNTQGASIAFSIAPAFYQTWWFKLICALIACILLWMLHRLRLRVISARHRARLEERERIARELHDTLLQSTQGLILQFQAIAEDLPAHQAIQGSINAALDQADVVLAEGRDRVQELRTENATDIDLATILYPACAALGRAHPTQWRIVPVGKARALKAPIDMEVVQIAREALTNAFRHAKAGLIELRLEYTDAALIITVSDNGMGLPDAVQRAGNRAGHWGLQGMRERASKFGATLRIDTGAAGTAVALRVPATRAFRDAPSGLQRWSIRFGLRRA